MENNPNKFNRFPVDNTSVKLGYPLISARGLTREHRDAESRRQLLKQAGKIVSPLLRATVIESLSALNGYCGDFRIVIRDTQGSSKILPGRAADPGSFEGMHDPIYVDLPPGIKLKEVLPYLR